VGQFLLHLLTTTSQSSNLLGQQQRSQQPSNMNYRFCRHPTYQRSFWQYNGRQQLAYRRQQVHGRAGGTHSTRKALSELATRNIRVQAESVAGMWLFTLQIGAGGTGPRVQKLFAEGLFSGAQ